MTGTSKDGGDAGQPLKGVHTAGQETPYQQAKCNDWSPRAGWGQECAKQKQGAAGAFLEAS